MNIIKNSLKSLFFILCSQTFHIFIINIYIEIRKKNFDKKYNKKLFKKTKKETFICPKRKGFFFFFYFKNS